MLLCFLLHTLHSSKEENKGKKTPQYARVVFMVTYVLIAFGTTVIYILRVLYMPTSAKTQNFT